MLPGSRNDHVDLQRPGRALKGNPRSKARETRREGEGAVFSFICSPSGPESVLGFLVIYRFHTNRDNFPIFRQLKVRLFVSFHFNLSPPSQRPPSFPFPLLRSLAFVRLLPPKRPPTPSHHGFGSLLRLPLRLLIPTFQPLPAATNELDPPPFSPPFLLECLPPPRNPSPP